MCCLIKCSTDTVNSDCSSNGVSIAVFMSHNEHVILSLYKFAKCMCLNTSLYSGIGSCTLAFASKVAYIVLFLKYYLISSSSKCHIYGRPCKVIGLSIGLHRYTYTKGDSYSHVISYIYSFYLI